MNDSLQNSTRYLSQKAHGRRGSKRYHAARNLEFADLSLKSLMVAFENGQLDDAAIRKHSDELAEAVIALRRVQDKMQRGS